jgi:hypothetical protein
VNEITSGISEIRICLLLGSDVVHQTFINISDCIRGPEISVVLVDLLDGHVVVALSNGPGEIRLGVVQMLIKQLLAPRETLLAISLLCQFLGFLGLLTRRRKLTSLGPRRINIRLIRSADIHPRNLKLRLLSLRTNHWVRRAQVGGTAASIIIFIEWRNLSANILLHLLIL